jgi:hypothetical protein
MGARPLVLIAGWGHDWRTRSARRSADLHICAPTTMEL